MKLRLLQIHTRIHSNTAHQSASSSGKSSDPHPSLSSHSASPVSCTYPVSCVRREWVCACQQGCTVPCRKVSVGPLGMDTSHARVCSITTVCSILTCITCTCVCSASVLETTVQAGVSLNKEWQTAMCQSVSTTTVLKVLRSVSGLGITFSY